jgi:ASPIC and UnbV/FG-GAP-like repeat
MKREPGETNRPFLRLLVGGLLLFALVSLSLASFRGGHTTRPAGNESSDLANLGRPGDFQPCMPIDSSGLFDISARIKPWKSNASLAEIAETWRTGAPFAIEGIDRDLKLPGIPDFKKLELLFSKYAILNAEGENGKAYELLGEMRAWVEKSPNLASASLYTVIFNQGVVAMRRGENENCIMCRGESSCILPIVPAAVHTNPNGSRTAIRHFTEYLRVFPQDLGARWLLNLAHMTLGEYPDKVDTRYLVPLDNFFRSEFNIGKFRDIGHRVGVDRFNMAGGAIMEDFDNDGWLDLATTSHEPTETMTYYKNAGDGTFVDRVKEAGLTKQLGGKTLVQTDYNNDGRMDLFISRGAWFPYPMPQSLLRNDGDGKFTDVTQQAGLGAAVNSTASRWADYDNDGWLDVFIVCELQTNHLYHNRGDGTFEDVTSSAHVEQDPRLFCKGADWLDFDNDGYPDLFVDNMQGDARLYHNDRNNVFTDVTTSMGIDGPHDGFSCWAWDYDNDGWLDIFATSFDRTLEDLVNGLIGQPHSRYSNRLFRNAQGKGFENKTKEAGLDVTFATMGCNFGDFDNDGWLDFYLGTGDPSLATLVPNRMYKNVAGRRFADITASSGTGNLQKGHGVSCADWDRDGDLDVFIEMGGAVPGDKYHNILFENPGQANHWLTVKLVGKKTNRAAIGARIKATTAGDKPSTVYRHISSGSSWGANPLQQHIGLARADKVARLEVYWPTSQTTQVFSDIPADQAIEITEFASDYRRLDWKPIPVH